MMGGTAARAHGRTGRRGAFRPQVGACICALLLSACGGPEPGARSEHIFVSRGESLAAIADSLASHGIISSRGNFLTSARLLSLGWPGLRGADRRLRPGRYRFPVGEHYTVILRALVTGRTDDEFVTVPEGATIWEIAGIARRRLEMDSGAVVAATRDPAFRERLGVPDEVDHIEGYLFPETYRVPYHAEPQQLVAQMVRQFLTAWDTAWDAHARDSLGMTRHEVITLASIVEAEARRPSERPTIAGVYLNRLRGRRPMRLEADPTVIYALGQHVRRVLLRHLRTPSPYNTYLHYGLPPGPINSPGRASIVAVLHPARHPYLFFVARPDGTHMFTRNAGEHADSVAVARRLRAEAEAAADSTAAAAAPPP